VETGEALANMVMREPSVSGSTRDKMKALSLRPNKTAVVAQEYGEIFSTLANEKERSQKSIASSERLSKNERKKVRDTIFGERENEKDLGGTYDKLEMIDERNEDEVSHGVSEEVSEETEYEYEYVEEEYPEGTPL
jgi:hypothetical protein